MSKRESLFRCNLIASRLYKRPATLEEIQDYLGQQSEMHGYNLSVSKRTFQRDLEDIRELMKIEIKYDFSRKVYYIADDGGTLINDRMQEAVYLFNVLHIGDSGLGNHIHFEQRKPQGMEHLYGILHAIRNKVCIRFDYCKFYEDEPESRLVEPYALKEARNRWYLLAWVPEYGAIRTFGLDRMSNLEITKKKSIYPGGVNIGEMYRHEFGMIYEPDKPVEDVLLDFEAFQARYVLSLPLHASQRIVSQDGDRIRISLKLRITLDFVMELLSYGSKVKVLEPASLVHTVKHSLQKTLEQYP